MLTMRPAERISFRPLTIAPAIVVLVLSHQALGQVGDYASHAPDGRSVVLTGASGERIRITPYGDAIARIQIVQSGEDFYPDDRYEMVESHDWEGTLEVVDGASALELSTAAAGGILISVDKQPMRLSFAINGDGTLLLTEEGGVTWSGNTVTESFEAPGADEHFAGLGHPKYGRLGRLDRAGTSVTVANGMNEGALAAPFYLSSRGYGVFLNTTFPHTHNLGEGGNYSMTIDGEGYGGQMDYFFIAGPSVAQIVDRYTQLTGRPRLPQRSIFGLHLSDKSDPQNDGERWWKSMITEHRAAGFAFDHQVNDNAWRESNEAYSGQMNSWFAWRADRFPDPAEYKQWCDENGVTVTLDLNRPGIQLNPSWDPALDIGGVTDYGACPDFTNPAARQWIWDLFWDHAFNPALGYPGDAIWLDEFDYPDHSHSLTLFSGKRWAEESINYHLNLHKACVAEGWDLAVGEAKRPYFWSRGATAGAQRWGTYWTGDLDANWQDMAYQVVAMQSAGVSGFPYFNHDAGAHFEPEVNEDNLFRQWDMAFGAFTPIWKPHGPGHPRWPLQRNGTCQDTARTYITARYELIPYIYSYAHIAQQTGMPMARPMFFEAQHDATAWARDMQYFWGHEMLVAPNASDGGNSVSVWLPAGNWYDFWDDTKYAGDSTENISAPTGFLPVFVREGAIIPTAPYALSTFFIPRDELHVHAYTGADGAPFRLYEDDGVSERFRTSGELRTTELRFTQQDLLVEIAAAEGTYADAPTSRSYQVIYHGLSDAPDMYVNGTAVESFNSEEGAPDGGDGAVWDSANGLLTVYVASRTVDEALLISSNPGATGTLNTGGDTGGAGGAGAASGGATAGGASSSAGAGDSGVADNPGGADTAGGTGGVAAAGSSATTGGVDATDNVGGTGTAVSGSGGASTAGPSNSGGAAPGAGGSATTGGAATTVATGGSIASGGGVATGSANATGTGGAGMGAMGMGGTGMGGTGTGAVAAGTDSGADSASDRDSGCSCTVPKSGPTQGAASGLLLGLALLRRRRNSRWSRFC